MATLKNFTLDGAAIRVVGYIDHHGIKRFDVELVPEFREKALTVEKLIKLANGLHVDTEVGGMLCVINGKPYDDTLSEFCKEDLENGIRMHPSSEERV